MLDRQICAPTLFLSKKYPLSFPAARHRISYLVRSGTEQVTRESTRLRRFLDALPSRFALAGHDKRNLLRHLSFPAERTQ
jgi:hypothetical protein